MKRNVLACGALVLGMVAGFAIRGALETADAIPPQTQAAACIATPEIPALKPAPALEAALPEVQLENSDVYRVFLHVGEKTAAGYDAASQKETESIDGPLPHIAVSNGANAESRPASTVNSTSSARVPIVTAREQWRPKPRWEEDVTYVMGWDTAKGWFDYGWLVTRRHNPFIWDESFGGTLINR